MPGDLNPPRGMQGARHHGWQPQSTMSDYPYFIAPGVSTQTHSKINLRSLLPHETLRSPQYGFHSQSASPSYPHLQFSGPVTSSVTNRPVILGYSYPYGNRMIALLQAPQPQSASPGDAYLNTPMSSVIHPPVIPGYSSYPYGNSMRAPLLSPQPQSARPGGPHYLFSHLPASNSRLLFSARNTKFATVWYAERKFRSSTRTKSFDWIWYSTQSISDNKFLMVLNCINFPI